MEENRSIFSDKPKIVLGEKEEFIHLIAVAKDLVKLIPDVEKRMKLLSQIDIPYFDISSSNKIIGKGKLTESSLFKIINIKNPTIIGNYIKYIGLDLITDEENFTEKDVSVTELAEKLGQEVEKLRTVYTNEWKLPDDNSVYFIPREKYQTDIVDYFGTDKSIYRTVVVNAGLGGVGKTQLAINYAHHAKKEYSLKLWFGASTRDQLLLKYRAFALEKGLIKQETESEEFIIKAVCSWLNSNPGWLIVFDNVENEDVIKEFLPSTGGDVLITSRWQNWSYNKMGIDVMAISEAVSLLKKSIDPYNQRIFTDQDEIDLNLLAEKLGRLPLALAQAGAYIKSFKGHKSIAEYIKLFDEHRALLLVDNRLPTGQAHEPVAVTWHISMEAMKKASCESVELLYCSAYLNQNEIPLNLIEHFFEESQENVINDPEQTAKDYSMISIDATKNTFSMHNLVQEVIRILLSKEEEYEYMKKASYALNKIYPYRDNKNFSFELKKVLKLHLKTYLKEYQESLSLSSANKDFLEEKILLKCLINYADSCWNSLQTEKQKIALEEALIIENNHVENTQAERIQTMADLGICYGLLNRLNESVDLLEKAWNTENNIGTKTEKNINNILFIAPYLAHIYVLLGRPLDGQKLLEPVLTTYDEILQKDKSRLATILHNMSNVYNAIGEHEKARDYLSQSLETKKKNYGNNHPALAVTLTNLGDTYLKLNNIQEAENNLILAIEIDDQHLEKTHRLRLKSFMALCHVYLLKNDIERTEEFLRLAKEIKIQEGDKVLKELENIENKYNNILLENTPKKAVFTV